jgi:hypothetical protein
MRIEVSVPGIWKERGKLPARTTPTPGLFGAVSPPDAWPSMCDALVDVGAPFASGSEQPVSSASAAPNPAAEAAMPARLFLIRLVIGNSSVRSRSERGTLSPFSAVVHCATRRTYLGNGPCSGRCYAAFVRRHSQTHRQRQFLQANL